MEEGRQARFKWPCQVLRGVPDSDVSHVVQRMVEEHALANCERGITPHRHSREAEALQCLIREGFAEDAALGARLTAEASPETYRLRS